MCYLSAVPLVGGQPVLAEAGETGRAQNQVRKDRV